MSICLAQASNVWAAYPGSAKHDHVVSVDAALFDTWSKHEAAFVATVERALAKAADPPGVLCRVEINLHAIEQMEFWGQRRVDGVGT